MKQLAKISGIAYVMIFLAGFYANFAVLESLIDGSNPSITTANLINSHSQFGNGLIGFTVMLVFDIVLVWSLFNLTKSVNKKISYIASFFRLLHAVFFLIAVIKLLKLYQLTFNFANSSEIEHVVVNLLSSFNTIWTIGLLFFGGHLIVLGYLVLKSIYIPKALGVLLILSAIGYFIDGFANLFMHDYANYKDIFEVIVIMPAVIGEFSFTIWLLFKGFNNKSFIVQNI